MLCQSCKTQYARIHDTVIETLPDGTRTKAESHWCHTCAPTDLIVELMQHGEDLGPEPT